MSTAGRSVVRLAAVAVALGLGLGPTTSASAHAELTSSSPSQGQSVDALPDTVELTFSEAVGTPAYVSVTDPAGREISTGEPEILDGDVTQPTAPSGVAGTYTVDYRVVSADGHPVEGSVDFTVTSGTAAPASVPEASEGFWSRHWEHLALAGVGLVAGVALLGTGLRGRS